MANPLSDLKCSFWNIEGHNSKIIGNKLEDPEFLNVVRESDIIGLAEIHAGTFVSIPGFKSLKQKIREKKFKGPKIAGGIGVFVRQELSHIVQVVPNNNNDSIWVKVNKKFLHGEHDLYIGTYYGSPTNSTGNTNTENFFNTLNEEILSFRQRGVTLVQGDLNARTGNVIDFIESDKSDEELGITNVVDQFIRNSEDQVVNNRGKELLDVCKQNDMIILNGRKIGDLSGKFTSHQWNGSAVVDYVLIPHWFSKNILKFSIGEFIPWLSDHCPTHTHILSLQNSDVEKDETTLTELHPGFIWNEDARESFEEGLKSSQMRDALRAVRECGHENPITVAREITNILIKNASQCNRKKSKPKKREASQPWFDQECERKKNIIRNLGKNLRNNPSDQEKRKELRVEKKTLKKLVKVKKILHKNNIVNKMVNLRSSCPRDFWKLFRRISPNKDSSTGGIHPDSFGTYFKTLLNSKENVDIPADNQENGILDYEISSEEINDASPILKLGKSHGIDNVCNEMIKPLVDNYPELLRLLFNLVLKTGIMIPEWILGLIVPIFKKGDKSEASNYRGITLTSCLGKLFIAVLNNRLLQYAVQTNIISKNQLGFLKQNRCSDAHIIFNNIVQKRCHKNGGKLFCSFIDFSKAFDTVPRDLLFKKLQRHGVNGRFFNIIKSIYTNDQACVKTGSQCTKPFDINQGVRQGCVLSPLLFNIFLADLAKDLDEMDDKIEIGAHSLNSIFWADDILMFAKDKDTLQIMLSKLENSLEVTNAQPHITHRMRRSSNMQHYYT